MARRKLNQRDIPAMIAYAQKAAKEADAIRYLNPTVYGLALDTIPGIGGVQHYRIMPDGEVWFVPHKLDRHLEPHKVETS